VRISKSRLRLVLIAGLVLAGSASAGAVALAGRATPHRARPVFVTRFVHTAPLSHYRPAIHARVIAGSPIERAAAAQAIRDFGAANRILRIDFTTAPAAFHLPSSAVWVSVEVSTPDKPGVVSRPGKGCSRSRRSATRIAVQAQRRSPAKSSGSSSQRRDVRYRRLRQRAAGRDQRCAAHVCSSAERRHCRGGAPRRPEERGTRLVRHRRSTRRVRGTGDGRSVRVRARDRGRHVRAPARRAQRAVRRRR
jgi:hypothetical protein